MSKLYDDDDDKTQSIIIFVSDYTRCQRTGIDGVYLVTRGVYWIYIGADIRQFSQLVKTDQSLCGDLVLPDCEKYRLLYVIL